MTYFDVDWKDAFGPPGTPYREMLDRRVKRYSRATAIAEAVTRHWPRYMALFWQRPVIDQSIDLRGWLDYMSFCYMGDFLFAGRPVTESYHQSWMSKVHLPWRKA